MKTIEIIMIMGLFNYTIMVLMLKWKIFEKFHEKKPKWLKWFKECYFCHSLQISILEAAILYILTGGQHFIYIPFCSAAITYYLFSKL